VQAASGGILALPTNIGDYDRAVFSIVPEFGINADVNLTRNLRLLAGYSILLWTHVARPGNQLDTAVSPGLAPSDPSFGATVMPTRPFFTFRDEVFWVHAFSLGLEYRY
jgi:hypothetical protein